MLVGKLFRSADDLGRFGGLLVQLAWEPPNVFTAGRASLSAGLTVQRANLG
jgi:hypothetical protein